MGFKNWIDEDRPVMTAIDWKARAEFAEIELAVSQAEARGMRALYDAAISDSRRMVDEIDALTAELAALKAANEWRPVTDGRL